MTLYFITGNDDKFEEAQNIIGNLEQLDIDLPEIQGMEAETVLESKLYEAFDHYDGEFIVEDTSLYMDCLNGLPGPMIKWFLKSIGNEGLYKLADNMGDNSVEARTIVGYATSPDDVNFFEGKLSGKIVEPRGDGFGWDPIFQPEGYDRVFGEFTTEEKNEISMRGKAFEKLSEYLGENV